MNKPCGKKTNNAVCARNTRQQDPQTTCHWSTPAACLRLCSFLPASARLIAPHPIHMGCHHIRQSSVLSERGLLSSSSSSHSHRGCAVHALCPGACRQATASQALPLVVRLKPVRTHRQTAEGSTYALLPHCELDTTNYFAHSSHRSSSPTAM